MRPLLAAAPCQLRSLAQNVLKKMWGTGEAHVQLLLCYSLVPSTMCWACMLLPGSLLTDATMLHRGCCRNALAVDVGFELWHVHVVLQG